MSGTHPRKTNAYMSAAVAWLQRQPMVCHWCGRPVSTRHKPGHPAKATVDHTIEVDRAASLAMNTELWVVACWGCNSSRGATYGNRAAAHESVGIGEPSRDW